MSANRYNPRKPRKVRLEDLEDGEMYKLSSKVQTEKASDLPQIFLDLLHEEYRVLDSIDYDGVNYELVFLLNPKNDIKVPQYIAEEEAGPHAAPLETQVDVIRINSLWLPDKEKTMFLKKPGDRTRQVSASSAESANQNGGKRKTKSKRILSNLLYKKKTKSKKCFNFSKVKRNITRRLKHFY